MSAQLDFRRGLGAAVLVLGLGVGGCTPTPGNVAGPDIDRPAPPSSRVEGKVFRTGGLGVNGLLPAENLPVQMIWTEVEDPSGGKGGIEAATLAVPVAEGELPRNAQVRVARTDVAGRFVHPTTTSGGVSLRVGSWPENCRRPADRVVSLGVAEVQQVEIIVICTVPKPPPAQ